MSVCIARLVEARFVQALGLRVLPAPVPPVVRVRVYHPAPVGPVVIEALPDVTVLPDGTRLERFDFLGVTDYVPPEREPKPARIPSGFTRPARLLHEQSRRTVGWPVLLAGDRPLPRNPLRLLWRRLAMTVEVYRAQFKRWQDCGTAPDRRVGPAWGGA